MYLFYYVRCGEESSFVVFYECFFRILGIYKRVSVGGVIVVCPTFGYISGWIWFMLCLWLLGLCIVFVGDAVVLYSLFMFCGFGLFFWIFGFMVERVVVFVEGCLVMESVDESVYVFIGAFAVFMVCLFVGGEVLNELFDVVFGMFVEFGEETYASLF